MDPIVLNTCNYLCNEYGMDTITVGGTVAWAMECFDKGILSKEDLDGIELNWGAGPAITAITEKICKCEGVGKILANGSCFAADHFGRGHECLVVAGKMEIPQHDSRFSTGLARTYKFDPTPGRHVKGGMGPAHGFAPPEVKHNPDTWAEQDIAATVAAEIVYAAGLCCFADFMIPAPAVIGLVNGVTGFDITEEERVKLGKRIFTMRHAFNIREGYRRSDTTISDRIIGKPPLKEGPVTDITVDVEKQGDNFYRLMGYDIETSVPLKQTLEELGGLEDVLKDLYPDA
jgi:aldehyde:ferredoxin oxidoreductase